MEHSAVGRVHSVETFGAVDGPGLRYIVFMQGCALRCAYCHNPDSWDMDGGDRTTAQQVVDAIVPYKNFIKNGGVTLSGGEPMLQSAFTLEILERCRLLGLHTAVDTAGSVPLSIAEPIVRAADMLLLDMKASNAQLCAQLTGRSDVFDHAMAVLDLCQELGKPVWIRHVLVPNLTMREELVRELAALLRPYSCIERVDFLPFHKMGEYKWDVLGAPYTLRDTPAPTAEETQRIQQIWNEETQVL